MGDHLQNGALFRLLRQAGSISGLGQNTYMYTQGVWSVTPAFAANHVTRISKYKQNKRLITRPSNSIASIGFQNVESRSAKPIVRNAARFTFSDQRVHRTPISPAYTTCLHWSSRVHCLHNVGQKPQQIHRIHEHHTVAFLVFDGPGRFFCDLSGYNTENKPDRHLPGFLLFITKNRADKLHKHK